MINVINMLQSLSAHGGVLAERALGFANGLLHEGIACMEQEYIVAVHHFRGAAEAQSCK